MTSKFMQHLTDCQNLPATELRRRYPAEANSHRNMLQRVKTQGRTVHPAFKEFRDFLALVGPRPCKGATLDRINNDDSEYGPGKVRWADKRTQNNNKGDTLLFHHSGTGDTYTVSRLAKLQKVSPSTIRKRKERGWSDDEILEPRRRIEPVLKVLSGSKRRSKGARHYGNASQAQSRPVLSAAEIAFKREVDYVAFIRETEGQEYCLADIDSLNDLFGEVGMSISQEQYERAFARWWKKYKPHLVRADLPQWAQDFVARIEGDASAAPSSADAKRALRDEL